MPRKKDQYTITWRSVRQRTADTILERKEASGYADVLRLRATVAHGELKHRKYRVFVWNRTKERYIRGYHPRAFANPKYERWEKDIPKEVRQPRAKGWYKAGALPARKGWGTSITAHSDNEGRMSAKERYNLHGTYQNGRVSRAVANYKRKEDIYEIRVQGPKGGAIWKRKGR